VTDCTSIGKDSVTVPDTSENYQRRRREVQRVSPAKTGNQEIEAETAIFYVKARGGEGRLDKNGERNIFLAS